MDQMDAIICISSRHQAGGHLNILLRINTSPQASIAFCFLSHASFSDRLLSQLRYDCQKTANTPVATERDCGLM